MFETVAQVNEAYQDLVINKPKRVTSLGGCKLYNHLKPGYSRTSRMISGKPVWFYVHQLTLLWKLQKNALEPGQETSHLCHNASCIDPDHLTSESHAVNMQRKECANERKVRSNAQFCFGHGRQPNCI